MFIDSQNRARAFVGSFFISHNQNEIMLNSRSAPVKYALDRVRRSLRNDEPVPTCYTLGIELGVVRLGEAKEGFGLTDEWIEKLSRAADADITSSARNARDVLKVINVMAGTEPSKMLKVGDLILQIDDIPQVAYDAVDLAAAKAGDANTKVKLTLLRDGQITEVMCTPHSMTPLGTQRIVRFCGMQVQEPHPHVAFIGFIPQSLLVSETGLALPGAYVSCIDLGSPSEAYEINAQRWIVEIDEKPIRSLDEFLKVVRGLKQGDIARMVSVGLDGVESVHALDIDLHYFPLMELFFDPTSGSWTLT